MKSLTFLLVFLLVSVFTFAQTNTWVDGHFKQNGTWVDGHYRQTANQTNHDNWSTQGQYNPFNGTQGTRPKDNSREAYNYGQGKTIFEGPRGGQYYYNEYGRKVYVPKR